MSISQSLFGGGNFPSQPTASGTTVATTEFPPELAPFIKDILEKSKAMQSGAAYQPYTGAQIAPFNPLEQEAMTALESQTRGLAGTDVAKAAPYFTGAKTAIEGLGQQFTGDIAQQFMNPYQQAVTDQAKLKATEDYEAQQNVLAANAIKNQPFGGSRQAITEGMAQGDYLDRLSNIQERGLAAGFTQGRAGFEAQKGRELQMANQLMGMGATVPQQAYRDLGIRQQIGETQRAQDQMALDLGTKQFMEEREFPTRALQEYSATVRGFPFQPSTYTTQTSYQPQPGIGQQLVNLAGQGLGGYTAFTGQPMQNLFQAEGGITTLPTYYNQRGDNDQRQISIYDLIDTQTPEAQQFYEEQALAQEQQELAEAQQLDAMDLEYYIEEQNRPKSLIEKVGNILYSPQQGIKNILEMYDRKQIGNRLRPNLRRAEGGLTGLPIIYNQVADNQQNRLQENNTSDIFYDGTGQAYQVINGMRINVLDSAGPVAAENDQLWDVVPENKRELIVPPLDLNTINPDSDLFRGMSKEEIQKMFTSSNINTDQINNFSTQPFIGGDSSVYTPPIQLDNTANMVQDMDITNTTDLLNNIPVSDYEGQNWNEQDLGNYIQMLGIQPTPTNITTEEVIDPKIDLNNLTLDKIKKITNIDSEVVEAPEPFKLNREKIDELGMIAENLKNIKQPTNTADLVKSQLERVKFDALMDNVLKNYERMASPKYATELKGGASERQALGQGLAMMKAFSSSDPTKGIIGNLSEQIGSFAENVEASETKYLQEIQAIDNLGMEAPIQALDAISDTITSAYGDISTRDVQRDSLNVDEYLRTERINLEKDTLGYKLMELLYNSNISQEQLRQKGIEINNNSKFNQQTLTNDLITTMFTYKGTLASANLDLAKITKDAIDKGYLDTAESKNIYNAVAAGIIGDQIISEGNEVNAETIKIFGGKALNAATMVKVNQAMADIVLQVGNRKMRQSLDALSGKIVEDKDTAAALQAHLINQYKIYYSTTEANVLEGNEAIWNEYKKQVPDFTKLDLNLLYDYAKKLNTLDDTNKEKNRRLWEPDGPLIVNLFNYPLKK
jgi:hypothetical protein